MTFYGLIDERLKETPWYAQRYLVSSTKSIQKIIQDRKDVSWLEWALGFVAVTKSRARKLADYQVLQDRKLLQSSEYYKR